MTSRERLNIQGEWVYDVGGLTVPHDNDDTPAIAHSAPTLFRQTAQRLQPGFAPTATDETAILQICRLVDGMPLALVLAASWIRVLSCPEIMVEIQRSLDFLTTTRRSLPSRHRSIRAVFDHSWQLLSIAEKQTFARCSVFRDGFTREAAERVAGATLPGLAALVDKSLLSRNREGRYVMHELARQYGADQLAECDGLTPTCNAHLTFFLTLAEEADSYLERGLQIIQ